MERTEQMYTIQKQMDFGKIKVSTCTLQSYLKHLVTYLFKVYGNYGLKIE